MTIQEILQGKMIEAMRIHNVVRRDNIKFLIGQFQNKAKNKEKLVTDQEAIGIIKSLLNSTKELTIPLLTNPHNTSLTSKDPSNFSIGIPPIDNRLIKAMDFVELCEELLPRMATEAEVIEFLTTIDFKSLKSPMQSIGITVKHFNGNVNPELVRNCLPFLGVYV